MKDNEIKDFYKNYSDKIIDNKKNSDYPLRSYIHKVNWESILKYIKTTDKVLEVGCGEGVLSIMMSQKGIDVLGSDISIPNIERAKKYADDSGLNIVFQQADAENLPFADNSFDIVVADNILEHVPNFEKALSEIKRVTRDRVIVALPTGFNLCAWCLLGGDNFWKFSKKTLIGLPFGFLRFIYHILGKGVNQGYASRKDLPHLWRYPWVMKRELKEAGFGIVEFEASSLCLPYFNFLLPVIKWLDKYKNKPIIRNLGYGSIAVLKKKL